MRRAYELAARSFLSGAENRVLLLSDGVANLGTLAAEDILTGVADYRKQGITCSVFGFGIGTYDDTMLEALANKGDGAYVFIDSEEEARRVFVDDLAATLNTVATDVKIQVEFNQHRVARYRQLGYENRQLKKEDFRNDAVDAGEVGSGQSVTALYELELKGPDRAPPLAVVRLRFRRKDTGVVEEIERAITEKDLAQSFETADARFRLATCAAEFAEILRGSPFAAGSEFEDVATRLRPVLLDLPLDHDVRDLLHLIQSAPGMSRGEL
jgi:Ca-activated chloride channel family protein